MGDVIVWWRVCVLWRKKRVFALGVVLIAGMCGASPNYHSLLADARP